MSASKSEEPTAAAPRRHATVCGLLCLALAGMLCYHRLGMIGALDFKPATPPALKDVPTASYIVLAYNRDHDSCLAPAPKLTPATSLMYTNFIHSGFGLSTLPCYKASLLNPKWPYMQPFRNSSYGVEFRYYLDDKCTNPCTTCKPDFVAFGGCFNHITVDITDTLPTPVPGQVLVQTYGSNDDCENYNGWPYFKMHSTECYHDTKYKNDFEITCGEGVSGSYNNASFKLYASSDRTCTGTQTAHITHTIDTCANSIRLVWCGAPCRIWSRLAYNYPICDGPTSGGAHPVDLEQVLGPRCYGGDKQVGAGQCCYIPLGYDGGAPLGTDCETACATAYWRGQRTHRLGDTNAFCMDSSKKYGNCFCGPKFSIDGY